MPATLIRFLFVNMFFELIVLLHKYKKKKVKNLLENNLYISESDINGLRFVMKSCRNFSGARLTFRLSDQRISKKF